MSNVIVPHNAGDETLYFLVIDADGKYWNTAGTPAFEAYDAGNYGDYDITLTETGDTEIYVGTFPAVTANQWVTIIAKKQAGASPAAADDNVASGTFWWDGTDLTVTQQPLSSADTQAAVTAAIEADGLNTAAEQIDDLHGMTEDV